METTISFRVSFNGMIFTQDIDLSYGDVWVWGACLQRSVSHLVRDLSLGFMLLFVGDGV